MKIVSGRTACVAVTTFPWKEKFEDYAAGELAIPCWLNERIVDGTGNGSLSVFKIYTSTNGGNSTHQLQLPDMKAGTKTKLVLPLMEIPENEDYQFVIDVYRNASGSSATTEGVRVLANTTDDTTGATELAFLYRNFTQTDNNHIPAETASGWYTYELPIGMTGNVYIILLGESQYGSSTYMDNLMVRKTPTCLKVTGIAVVDSLATSSSITLTYSNEDGDDVVVINMADSSIVATSNDTLATVNGLSPNTPYTFGVYRDCGGEDYSDTMFVSGRTACGIIASLPWNDGMEAVPSGSNQMPYCWSRYNNLTTGNSYYPYNTNSSSYAHSGNYSLYWYYSAYGTYADTAIAILPQLDVTTYPMNGNQLSFWGRMSNSTQSITVYVGTMSDPEDVTTFTTSGTVTVSGATHTRYDVNLTEANATDAYAAIMVLKPTGSASLYIDDVMLHEAPSCAYITGLTVTGATAESISLSWVDGDNTDATYSVYVVTPSDTTLVASNIADTAYTVEDRDANTAYVFGVVANCAGGDAEMVIVSGRTPCTAIELPYTENFEANGNFPCWTKVNCHASTGLGTSNPYSGTGCLYFNYNYNPPQYVISPELSGVDNGLQLSFMYRANGSYGTETFNVGFSTTTNDTAAFVWSDQVSTNSTTYAEYSQMMPAGTKYVAIRYTAYNQYYLYIDSMVFTPMEDDYCFPVANLAVDSVSANSISLSWVGNASNYVFLNMANGTEFTATADGNSVTIDGLNANTLYTIGVAVVCASGNSDTVTISGRTACAAIDSLPYTMGFENADLQSTTGATSLLFPFCWTRINNSTSDYYNYYPYAYNYGTPNNGSRHLYFNASTYGTYADTTGFVMPALDVETYPMDANRVTFWAKVSSASTPYKVIVGTMSTPADMSTFTVADTVTVANTDYAMYAVSLATAEATDAYVAFLVPKVASSMYIDDVTLEPQPNCADVTGLTLDSMMTTTAYISWNDVDADSYEVEVRQGDSVITDANVLVENDTTATISDLSLDNDYQIYVRSVCGGDYGAWAPALNIHVGYCQPNPTSRDGQGIIGVAFGGMTNTSSHPTAAPYYINNASMMGYVPAGTTATVDITYATAYTYGTIIWVDWNNSLTFDANEVVYAGVSTNTNPTTLSATFAIPANQATGNYRMRIAGADSYFDDYTASLTAASAANPCFTSSYAVAEDYTLVVIDALTCPMVSNVYDDSLTTDGAMLHWTGNDDAVSYRIYAMADTTLVATVTDTFAVLTGLDANTVYTYGVASACSGNDESPVVTVTFRTACSAIALPYTEDFENGIDCWRLVDCEPNTKVWTNNPYSGTSCFGFTYNLNPPQYLISPEFTGGDNGVDLSFMYRVENSNYAESFVVGYSTTTNDTAAFIWGVEQTGLTNLTYAAHSEYLPAGTKYVAIKYTANNMWRLYIDSMVFDTMTASFCFPAAGLTVDSASENSVTISWSGSAATYTVYNGNTQVATGITGTSYTFTGLTANTSYTFGVVANCTATDESEMRTIVGNTACGTEAIALPYTETFDVSSASRNCWTTFDADHDGYNWSTLMLVDEYSYDRSEANMMISESYNEDGALTPDNWLISPKIQTVAADTIKLGWTVYSFGSATYAAEHYAAYVSTTTTDTSAFTLLGEWTLSANDNQGTRMSIDLTAYAGQAIYVAFRHFNCTDMFYMGIDSVVVNAVAGQVPVTPTYTVTVNVNDATMGHVDGVPTAAVDSGAVVNLTAVPESGYHFVSWSNGLTTAAISLIVTSDTTVTATFEANPANTYTVAVSVNDAAMGHVDGIPTEPVTAGTVVNMTAVPETGYRFVNWTSGATVISTTAALALTVTSDTTVTANFELMPENPQYYTVTVNYDATKGTVTGIPTEPVLEGSSVRLTAEANDGYKFAGWVIANDTVDRELSYTISNIQSNVTITAVFVEKVGIDDIDMENVKVYSTNDVIYVNGAEGMSVSIFDVNGRILNQTEKAGENVEFRVAATGVYLVKVGNAAAKRVVVMR